MKAIEAQTYMGGGTNTADAIKYMNAQMFSQNSGARGNVPRITVVITNGASANPGATVSEADKARMNNIGFYAIGVGSNVVTTELNNIADQPSSDHVFTVNSYDNLDSITNQLINRMCTVKATVPSLTTSRPGGTLPPDPCSDRLSNCASYGQQVCRDYRAWANDNCKRTCNFCTPLYTVAPPTCKDKLSNCASYGQDACGAPGTWARDNCQLSCGFCGPDTNSVGFYGKCSFKGKTYNHGEKWYDGCDYECICEDGSSGRYKCNNRCPVYYNLPLDCTLVSKPGQCCQEPVCNFDPKVNVYTASGKGTNPHGISVCEYKNKQYLQGQSWRDGCDFQCTCVDSNKGEYKCEDLCPVYHSIPPACHLEQQAGECCKKPVCEYDQQTGSFTGYGSISGQGVGSTPTQAPPCIDSLRNCHEYGMSVCTAYRSWSIDNCKKYCNMCPSGEPQPSADDKCIYNGKMYTQGESWNVSCDTMCTCENSIYGYYRCVNTCPQYSNIPSGCYEQKKAGDCCPTIQCDTGYFFSSSNNIGTIGNGGMLNVSNPPSGMTYVYPTLPSGEKPRPGSGGTGFQAPSLMGCLYKGQLYVQNQAWEDGCEYSCYCKDAISGLYSCRRKCPSYPDLPASCHLEADPNEPCCRAPVCSIDPVTHKTPVPLPVFQPATQVYGVVQPPYKVDTSNTFYTNQVTLVQPGFTPAPPTLSPGAGSGTGGIGFCTYNGVQYKQGELWEDGCDFNCICEDASNGFYRCVEKCVHYGNLPTPACFLIDDPINPCCKIPKCIFVNNFITHIGHVTTTPKPRGEYCVYEGTEYRQGQSWYDGCSYKCTCENAAQNVYRCMSRCPEYLDVQPGCHTIPDPRDPSCCVIPQCAVTGTFTNFTNNGQVFTNNGQVFTNNGQVVQVTPAPLGSFTGQGTGSVGYCEFKGVQYGQGQKWEDSCEYECTCTDAVTGFYRCTEKCKRYINLPVGCELITDFANPCCTIPQCSLAPAPGTFSGTGGTVAPTAGPTKAPTPLPPGQTLAPGLITPAPHYKNCVYKGAEYSQGQTWSDGCSYNCRCDNADRGLYVCNQRCAEYKAVPPGCTMVVDPRDSCCLVPQCTLNPPPTLAPNPSPHLTPYPGYTTLAPKPYPIPTAAPGQFIGSVNYPTPQPGQTPTPVKYCEYKGVQYNKGQRWDDGCDYVCECIDDTRGQYRCTEKCPRYVNLPPNCRLSKDPANPCCHMPECDWPIPSLNPNTPTPHPPSPGSVYTPAPTPGPVIFTPTPRPTLPPDVCVYKGMGYSQGQTWYDGCLYICSCENGKEGIYRCNNRCPRYQSLPSECYLIPDPNDPLCCQKPKCDLTPKLNNTSGYVNIPTAAPGIISGGYATPIPSLNPNPNPYFSPSPLPGGPTPSPIPGVSTQKPPIGPNLSPTPNPPNQQITPVYKDVCVYKGQQYTQGQKWSDGCDYDCQCLDAKTGQYQCKEKCPVYLDLPPECRLVRDYLNPCCEKPYCETIHITPTPRPTLSPSFGPTLSPNPLNPSPLPGSTRSPTPNVCVYNGVTFKQGASWNDGCDLVCSCEDASTGFYRCNDRCPKYDAPNCQMMTDPRDSCCRVPFCTSPQPPTIGPTQAPNSHPTLSPPFFSTLVPNPMNPVNTPYATPYPGYTGPTPKPGHIPTMAPSPNPFPTPTPFFGSIGGTGVNPDITIKGCMYHGVMYRQGQQWQDGCSYNCECIDEDIGRYKCLERCPLYLSIPSYCRLIVDPKDSCCKSPECVIPTPTHAPMPTPNLLPTASPLPNHSTVSPPVNPTLVPNPQNTPVPPTPAPRDVCVYKGQAYVQGQTWFDGCDIKCVCEDGKTGFYRCNNRSRNSYHDDSVRNSECDDSSRNSDLDGSVRNSECDDSSRNSDLDGTVRNSECDDSSRNSDLDGSVRNSECDDSSRNSDLDGSVRNSECDDSSRNSDLDGSVRNSECDDSSRNSDLDGSVRNSECDDSSRNSDLNGSVRNSECDDSSRNSDLNGSVRNSECDDSSRNSDLDDSVRNSECDDSSRNSDLDGSVRNSECDDSSRNSDLDGSVRNSECDDSSRNSDLDGSVRNSECDDSSRNSDLNGSVRNSNYNDSSRKVSQTMTAITVPEKCAKYRTVPDNCYLVADPNDPMCCQVPQCIPIPGQNGVPTPLPSSAPVVITGVPGGSIIGIGMAPTPTPGPDGSTPVPRDACIYGGVVYHQDQKWQDGCKYNCTCIEGMTGKYRCDEICPTYPFIPPQCHMKRNPDNLCCYTPVCDFNQKVPTPAPPVTPYAGPTPGPSGVTPSPGTGPNPTPGVTNVPPTLQPPTTQSPIPSFCVYNGVPFRLGQTWTEGCSKKCRCDNADQNIYTCFDRCPTYTNIAASCQMVADSNDPCCQIPQCTYVPTPAPTQSPPNIPGQFPTPFPNGSYPLPIPGFTMNPTPFPNGSYPSPIPGSNIHPTPFPNGSYPSPIPGSMSPTPGVGVSTQMPPHGHTNAPTPMPIPSPIPTAPTGIIYGNPQLPPGTSRIGYCEYKGVQYKQGQKWDDGCSYNCECMDENSGQYRCMEKCPRYAQIPSYCTMVQDPNEKCCKTPYCPGLTPTLSPTKAPNYPPGVSPTPGPVGVSTQQPPHGFTVAPPPTQSPPLPQPKEVCIYNGRMYTQGQRFFDGCDKVCACDNGMTGAYTCTDRCPTYNLSPNCVMVPDPNDPICCKAPKCDQTNKTVITGVTGSVVGYGTTPVPTMQPVPTFGPPGQVLSPTPGPGVSYPSPGTGSTLVPQPGTHSPTPAPRQVCVYKGRQYTQGQRWQDGCLYNCECIDGMTGQYRCTDRCPRYPNLPSSCRLVSDTLNPCCQKVTCDNGVPTLAPPSGVTLIPGFTPSPGLSNPTPRPGMSPTPGPGPVPVNPIPFATPSLDFCVYQGVPFRQGQTFTQGCDKICKCEDAVNGKITCTERCPTYQALQPGCTLTTDQNDPCCQVPTCINLLTNNPDHVVTGVVGTVTGTNLPDPSNPYPAGTNNACVYNGKMYSQGQTWEDGCKYTCVCEDSSTGLYRCTEKCPRYAQIPSTCTMMEDPNNKCCEKPFCVPSVPQPVPTPFPNPNLFVSPSSGGPQPGSLSPTLSPNVSPSPGVSTPKPATLSPDQQPTAAPNPNTPSPIPTPKPREVCTYNGDVYQQGQLWYDGCNAICRCENASSNFYRCQQRCGDYPNLPTACYLIPDPKDPTCCERPECPLPTPMGTAVPTPGFIDVTGSPLAVVTGIGKVPTLAPTPNPYPTPQPGVSTLHPPTLGPGMSPTPHPPSGPIPTPAPKTGCMYKGFIYNQGQKWDDGCDYECECIDEHTGQYRCMEKCPRYSSISQQCILLQDPKNPCCQKPYCDFVNPTPFPTGYPTPQPNLIPTPGPGVMTAAPYVIPFLAPTPSPVAGPSPKPGSPTPAPNAGPYATPPPGYCVYSGVYYTQGQTWDDGCKLKCKCEDVSRGFYTCFQRCPTYSNLPSSCVLRTDQNDPCCIVPDCNSIPTPMPPTPTPAPPGVSTQKPPTLAPGSTYPTPVPSLIIPTAISGSFTGVGTGNTNNLVPYNPSSSNAGFSSACVYKGTAYNQNQKWDDGCQYKCECLDGSRGMYRCTERCPKYYYLPPQCYYEKDPSDSCCQVAKCNPYATPVPQSPITLIPGSGTGPTGTNAPYNPVTGPGISGSNQPYTAYPGSGTGPTGTNAPYNPVTGPGISGSNQPYTAYPGSGTGPTGTNAPYNPVTGPGISGSVQPFTLQPNPGTGVSGTGQTITVQTPTMCVYTDGTQHAKGSRWQVGCQYDCVCDDPATNRFHCTGRCQAYSGLPSFCNLIDDPADKCCKTPQCILPGGATLTPVQGYGPSGTVPPGSLQVLPVGTHTVITGSNRPVGPNTGTGPVIGQRNVCVYKGSIYQQGQSWDDSCDYVCTCEDAGTGLYRCISKCPQYPPLPAYCKSANVPGLCCPSISCDIPGYGSYNPTPQLIPTPAPSPGPGGATLPPSNSQIIGSGYQTGNAGGNYPGGGYYLPNATSTAVTGGLYGKCVYKQLLYNQGEEWNDGCDFHCECKDGTTGYYECRPFCPTYNNLPSNQCYLVKADGQCCSQPMCYDPTTGQVVNPLTSSSVFPVVGSYVGGFSGFRPGYNFVPSAFGNSRRACVYKGQIYNQGDSWEDGCDYSCQCLDAASGQYMCRAKCPTYTKIPPLCHLIDQAGSCCKQITCQSNPSMVPDFSRPTIPPQVSTTTITGLCMDKLDNCKAYGPDACNGAYQPWAKRNCPAYCNFCQNTFTTTPLPCVDKLNNCQEFGRTACTGIYAPWATDNCRQFCGLCPQTGQLTTPTPTAACSDVDPNCASLGSFFCTGAYQQWASENCKKTCDLCGGGAVTTPIPTENSTIPVSGWLIFLKGVAGAPGPDLFQLWNGNETLNVNAPGANTFTAQFNGHYKPDYSNHWNDYCIDKVKVSIYNQGVEKANIIFDATGTDKMGWFSPDRILSSTWTDIKSAPKEIFSMLGDPSRGREFYASGHSTGCDAYGWIMISTKDTCFFEMGDKKPTFYYAPGQTQAHWQTNNPLTGDVFVIQAHPTCTTGQGTGGSNTQSTSYCDYKGKKYAQDATWDDGCDFTCTCVDASIGYQRCRPKCPQYTGLPDGCRIEKQPGQCCGSLNCNPGISTPGTINVTINPFSTCNYKGMYYNQGETWDDGCEFKCTCADASRGYYTCGAKCLTWKLPPACHLDPPAPGKCCKVPSCPSGYVINYPPGYKEE
ncbi:hypothetical protein CHS0354_033850 [Potamilus streckersoni]|uniref:Uncharacterized protein n=1 Tax=Potamilus streckersoni TaxID=2493646 RepID=A0AAE0RWV9_9BIVA|nr:hypothetical protein CHS0354_033850 [Potamilus streckersoni]